MDTEGLSGEAIMILGKRIISHKVEYFVRRRGVAEFIDTWEPISELLPWRSTIAQYEMLQRKKVVLKPKTSSSSAIKKHKKTKLKKKKKSKGEVEPTGPLDVRGRKARGLRVKVCFEENIWKEGEITCFAPRTNEYQITFDGVADPAWFPHYRLFPIENVARLPQGDSVVGNDELSINNSSQEAAPIYPDGEEGDDEEEDEEVEEEDEEANSGQAADVCSCEDLDILADNSDPSSPEGSSNDEEVELLRERSRRFESCFSYVTFSLHNDDEGHW